MKRFEFRLASVLQLREVQLDAETAKLRSFLAERDRLLKLIASIEMECKESLEWVRRSEKPDSRDLRSLSAFMLGSKAREATIRQSVESCNEDVDEQRKRVMRAERNQRLLIKLRDKRLAVWKYEADRELEALAQEAWQSAARKSKERADEILASIS